MTVLPFIRLSALVFVVWLLQACSAWKVNTLAEQLPYVGPLRTLDSLERVPVSKRDRVQYLLNKGLLEYYIGELPASAENLQQAKALMLELQAVSVTETVGASTVTEALRSYRGTPTDRVLVHVILAMNYLAQHKLASARVEILQADVVMQQMARQGNLQGQLAGAHFVSGLVYELGSEWDHAMISYRHALRAMHTRGQPIPDALIDSLLYVSYRQGLADEYHHYTAQFGRQVQLPDSDESELIVLYMDGVVIQKRQHKVPIFSPKLNQLMAVALPYYPITPKWSRESHLSVSVGNEFQQAQILEDINTLVREDLRNEMPAITAATLARAVAKYQASKRAKRKDETLGAWVNIAGFVSEQADTRSWNMLPSTIQVVRMLVPTDQSVFLQGGRMNRAEIIFSEKKVVLMGSSLNNVLYTGGAVAQ